jgi:signal transduction histidine kinase
MCPVNIARLIPEILPLVDQKAAQNKVEIVLGLPDEPLAVSGIPSMLQQVFLNLVLNALSAMPAGGVLRINGAKAGSEVIVSVCDTGKGIPEGDINRIFDPFFTTAEEGKGFGLGLAVCYAIVDKHKGRIEVESTPGKRTVFTVHLPSV